MTLILLLKIATNSDTKFGRKTVSMQNNAKICFIALGAISTLKFSLKKLKLHISKVCNFIKKRDSGTGIFL